MPQGHLAFETRNATQHFLPRYTDWLRGSSDPLCCDVFNLPTRLRLPWRYTAEQRAAGRVWLCGSVWLHSNAHANGTVYTHGLVTDLQDAVNVLAQDKDVLQYSLLVAEDGMSYDTKRFGGDHQVKLANGRMFTFSVRRNTEAQEMLLLAIAWN